MIRYFMLAFFLFTISILDSQAVFSQNKTTAARRDPHAVTALMIHPDAPPETQALGQLIGTWEALQVKRNRDGSWSTDTTHAEWRWYSILDGHAIQDDWIVFKGGEGMSAGRQVVGTNIRIYNSEEEQWYMAWIDKSNRRLATFTAANRDGKVIMTGHNAQGRLIRNTFSNLTEQSFDWVQEWTTDEGQNWFPVSKIHCRRKQRGRG